jgi:hypothetical protein
MLSLLAEKRLEVVSLEHRDAESYRTRPAPRDALADWRPAPHIHLAQALMLGLLVVGEDVARDHPAAAGTAHPDRPATAADLQRSAGVSEREPVEPRPILTPVGVWLTAYTNLGSASPNAFDIGIRPGRNRTRRLGVITSRSEPGAQATLRTARPESIGRCSAAKIRRAT